MTLSISRGLLYLATAAVAASSVLAEPLAPQEPAAVPVQDSMLASRASAGAADLDALSAAIAAARRGQAAAAQDAMARMSDPTARKLALWALVDADGEQLSFFQLDQARRDLAGWPRATRRQTVSEKALAGADLSPSQIIAWFQAAEPLTPQGAMALAGAEQSVGRAQDAQALIKHWWRDKPFDADLQRQMLSRFGAYLNLDDHIKRADTLLYGAPSAALNDILSMLPADQQALAAARIALRNEASDANAKVAALPASLAKDPGLAVDSARYLMSRNLDDLALQLTPEFPSAPPNPDVADKIWGLRRQLINAALRSRDYRAAYAAATNHGLTGGVDYADAEFYAGWIAFSKLHDPAAAEAHFANVQTASNAPITQARALYWRGRAAEARGDPVAAQVFYADGARYLTTFYGQLAADKAGIREISLGRDPVPTSAERDRFESRELVRAARMLSRIGEKELYRAVVLCMAEALENTEEDAMLVDLARAGGDQDLAMRVVRLGAQHGYVLPERGYPLRDVPTSPEAAEAAMVFGVTRQESGFDPYVRSPVGARGMMQLMPHTAEVVARRIGEPYGPGRLDDPNYNLRLGAVYLGRLINGFSGSYVMAAAGYNAGPGRPAEWVGYCGDPRSGAVDPVDFIECIPFSETRNYVMRVLEAAEVYRARLNGGAAPLTLAADLKRGGYVYQAIGPATPARAGAASIVQASNPTLVAPGVTVQGAVR